MLRGSFVPPAPIRELRELTRYRRQLSEEHAREANRVQKVLETANIKLGDVATDVLGVSGRSMLKALMAGEPDPEVLASLARGMLRQKILALREALAGRLTEHHAFMLRGLLSHIEFLEQQIELFDGRIEEQTRPFAAALERLDCPPLWRPRGAGGEVRAPGGVGHGEPSPPFDAEVGTERVLLLVQGPLHVRAPPGRWGGGNCGPSLSRVLEHGQ